MGTPCCAARSTALANAGDATAAAASAARRTIFDEFIMAFLLDSQQRRDAFVGLKMDCRSVKLQYLQSMNSMIGVVTSITSSALAARGGFPRGFLSGGRGRVYVALTG